MQQFHLFKKKSARFTKLATIFASRNTGTALRIARLTQGLNSKLTYGHTMPFIWYLHA